MKKLTTIVAFGLLACFAFTSVAAAAETPSTHQDFKAKVFGSKTSSVAKKGSVGSYLNPFHNETWPQVTDKTAGAMQVTPPFATVIAYIYLDKNVKFNADPFPGCPKDKVLALNPAVKGAAAAGCPKESQLGEGTAAGFARAVGAAPGSFLLSPTLQTRVFASGQKNTIWLYTYNETTKGNIIVGTLQKGSGKYGQKIKFVLPKGLILPFDGLVSQLSTFDSTIPAATYKGKHLMTLSKCPSNKKLNVGYQGLYSNNGTAKPGVSPVTGEDFVVTSQSPIINRTAKCK